MLSEALDKPALSRRLGLHRSPSLLALWIAGSLLLWLLYLFVFVQVAENSLGGAALSAFANVLPLTLLAVATRTLLKTYVMPLAVWAQVAAHAGLAVAFGAAWYGAVILMLAVVGALSGEGFDLHGFARVALTWQVFQGLVLYALVAALCYAVRGGREAASVAFVQPEAAFDRYLTKHGDELYPVEVGDIVSIVGAQDYAEVLTVDGRRHLVRLSLTEFERRLNGTKFLRVHRSTIINFAHLQRLEPAGGGRFTAHLAASESVEVSRSGAQLLRSLVV